MVENVLKAFSLKPGEKFQNALNGPFLCEYGTFLLDTLECIKIAYADKSKKGYVECNPGDVCTYVKDGTDQLLTSGICECGYNKDGKAYCPLPTVEGNYY
jgi:hypothetical protein